MTITTQLFHVPATVIISLGVYAYSFQSAIKTVWSLTDFYMYLRSTPHGKESMPGVVKELRLERL